MSPRLHDRTNAVWRFLSERQHGTPPSTREIAVAVGLSPKAKATVNYHIKRLIQLGYVEREHGVRAIRVLIPLGELVIHRRNR